MLPAAKVKLEQPRKEPSRDPGLVLSVTRRQFGCGAEAVAELMAEAGLVWKL